jgi:hypothetical protein
MWHPGYGFERSVKKRKKKADKTLKKLLRLLLLLLLLLLPPPPDAAARPETGDEDEERFRRISLASAGNSKSWTHDDPKDHRNQVPPNTVSRI